MFCRACFYPLKDLAGRGANHRCPECGRAFDPTDDKTFETDVAELREHARNGLFFIMVSVLLGMVLLGAFWATGMILIHGLPPP